jgi:hypothetical protein
MVDLGSACPGWGCREALVEEIVQELKKRQYVRGNTGMIQKSEEQLQKMEVMDAKLDLILNHLNLRMPASESMGR